SLHDHEPRPSESHSLPYTTLFRSLIAFLPVLFSFSEKITELPVIGTIPHALVWAAVFWAAFGTGLLALVGIKLPGLEFNNQRVEDRKSTRLNSSHVKISYAVFCLK